MKIILLGTSWPFRGGLATFNERLAKQFMAEGHDVEIWTFTLQYPSFLFPGKTQYSNEPAPEGIAIRRELNSWKMAALEAAGLFLFAFVTTAIVYQLGTLFRIGTKLLG